MAMAPPPPPPPSSVDTAIPGVTTPTPPPQQSQQQQQQQQPPEPQVPEIPDPGPWEQLGREAQEVLWYPNTFSEGLRATYNRGTSNNMQVSHSIQLGAAKDAKYSFAPTYVGSHKNEGSPQGFPVCLSGLDTNGNLTAQVIHEPMKGLTLKFNAQSQGTEWMGAQVEGQYARGDFSTGITLANPHPFKRTGIIVANYLQKLGSYFSAGAELVYQSADGHEQPSLSGALRYRTDSNTFLAKICPSQNNLSMSYHHKLDPKTTFATDLNLDAARGIAQASLGWQANYRTAIFRGCLTTNGEVAAQVEQDIIPQMCGISYNAVIDHLKGDVKFGFGFTLNS